MGGADFRISGLLPALDGADPGLDSRFPVGLVFPDFRPGGIQRVLGHVISSLALDGIVLPSSRLSLPSNALPGFFGPAVGLARSISLTALLFS